MAKYAVWDAAKETADLYDVSKDYTTKKVTTYRLQQGIKATALVHISCDSAYTVNIISPGEWDKLLAEAKNEEALHDQAQSIAADQPINWYAAKLPAVDIEPSTVV